MEDGKDRHKKIECVICGMYFPSDNLKRHVKTHKDILSMPDKAVRWCLNNKKINNTIKSLSTLSLINHYFIECLLISCKID